MTDISTGAALLRYLARTGASVRDLKGPPVIPEAPGTACPSSLIPLPLSGSQQANGTTGGTKLGRGAARIWGSDRLLPRVLSLAFIWLPQRLFATM